MLEFITKQEESTDIPIFKYYLFTKNFKKKIEIDLIFETHDKLNTK